jgi:hypothetical protein
MHNVKYFESECDEQGILREVGTKMPIEVVPISGGDG